MKSLLFNPGCQSVEFKKFCPRKTRKIAKKKRIIKNFAPFRVFRGQIKYNCQKLRQFGLFIAILCLSVFSGVSAQTDSKLVLKENVPSISSDDSKSAVNDISVKEWSEMEAALQIEDWNKTLALAEEYQQRLDAETKDLKKARLRYIYLYSLAGKVIAYSFSGDREQEEYARKRLEVAAKSHIGREFVFPVRKVLAECKGVINYVCDSTANPGFLHIAAANSNGTSILFSEYIEMRGVKLDVRKHNNADVILGGILKGIRLNAERSNKLVMTLQFKDGYVHRIYTNQ